MAPLPNAKHEKFAQAIVAGETQAKAYRSAGYTGGTQASAEAAGCRLLKNVKVRQRIAELQEAVAKRTVVTAESLEAEVAEIQAAARASGQNAAAVSAAKLRAELTGNLVRKSEAKVETTQTSALATVVQQLTAAGDGIVQIVPADGGGSKQVVKYRTVGGQKTYLVPMNITVPFAMLPEVITDTNEWLAQCAAAEARVAPVPGPGSDKVN